MHSRNTVALFVLASVFGIAAFQSQAQSPPRTLPSSVTVSAIEALSDIIDPESATLTPTYRSLQVIQPQEGLARFDETTAEARFVESSTFFLLFEPDVTEGQLRDYIDSNNIVVVETFPMIGAIQIRADLTRYLEPQPDDRDANDTLLRGLTEAVSFFIEHPIVRSASPDILLQSQWPLQNDIVPTPRNVSETNFAAPIEITDWGVSDIEADQLWTLPEARNGVILGVMDTGFAPHEDLVFIEFVPGTEVDDHGNHVAGVACAQHNGRGVRGVLPSCFVRARSADVFFQSQQGSARDRFSVLFAQILSTLTRFIDSQDDVHTFNVSMGYNWRRNFGINPDLVTIESEHVRSLVETQGAFLMLYLEAANNRGKAIVFG